MDIQLITPEIAAELLKALPNPRAFPDHPLLGARLVGAHLAERGTPDSPTARELALKTVVRGLVAEQLARRRAADAGAHGATQSAAAHATGLPHRPAVRSAALSSANRYNAGQNQYPSGRPDSYRRPNALPPKERGLIEADFLADDPERQAWSCLYYRYIFTPRLQVQELALVGRGSTAARRFIWQRLQLGYALLSDMLRQRELKATATDADTVSATVTVTHTYAGAPAVTPALPHHHVPVDTQTYAAARVAEWSQPRYRLERTFVRLTLLADLGATSQRGRWQTVEAVYDDLRQLLADLHCPALVLLGGPGAGKSTLLRRLEMDLASETVDRDDGRVTLLVPLGQYPAAGDGRILAGGSHRDPARWLAAEWQRRWPAMPPLEQFLRGGRATVLLDGLNELPHASSADYAVLVREWKVWLQAAAAVPGNRVIFSCRTLDYSAPLSTPDLRVPQVRVEPLDDAQLGEFLARRFGAEGTAIWANLAHSPERELLRTPFFAVLYADLLGGDLRLGTSWVGMLTRLVRTALRREVERDNALFRPGWLLSARDRRRLALATAWRTPHDLPDEGPLVSALAALAEAMQRGDASLDGACVELETAAARAQLPAPFAEDVLEAGAELGVLDEDVDRAVIRFGHQLVQEYFAARQVAERPDPTLARAAWRSADVSPGLAAVLAELGPGERVPALPGTRWDETLVLAAEMAVDAETFVRALMPENLVLAARAAAQPAVRSRLGTDQGEDLIATLQEALQARMRDPAADVRARVDAGLALGILGDPRFERIRGKDEVVSERESAVARTHGHEAAGRRGSGSDDLSGSEVVSPRESEIVLPPMVDVPAGHYVIGWDEAGDTYGRPEHVHVPAHTLALAAFRLGWYLVTNAEYACFIADNGYLDVRWWDTGAMRRWRAGHGTRAGLRGTKRWWRSVFLQDLGIFEAQCREGLQIGQAREEMERGMAMSDTDYDAWLLARYPDVPVREPAFWHREDFSNPSQPVVGVTWYEARAFANWLAARTGRRFRLPTEVEWEAAYRGGQGAPFATGDAWQVWQENTAALHLRRTTPVGIFAEGATPAGVLDMGGNAAQWTASLLGASALEGYFGYPYRAGDGREDAHAGDDIQRVVRGGAFRFDLDATTGYWRTSIPPGYVAEDLGFRLAESVI